jgi:hypothetical protein
VLLVELELGTIAVLEVLAQADAGSAAAAIAVPDMAWRSVRLPS